MAKILILLAHPTLEKSRVHARMVYEAQQVNGVTIHDLYQRYCDFHIDVESEKALLLGHDVIIWQHPFYWYSAPPLLKQWTDLVLEHGWAYGKHGKKLQGKLAFNAISTGGTVESYQPEKLNRFTIPQFLLPFNQTAMLCNMTYLPPYVVNGTHLLGETAIKQEAALYGRLLDDLTGDVHPTVLLNGLTYLNEIFNGKNSH